MKALHMVAFVLVVIGALNWGLVAVFDFNLVEKVLGSGAVTNAVYALVGLSAIVIVATHGKTCRLCKPNA